MSGQGGRWRWGVMSLFLMHDAGLGGRGRHLADGRRLSGGGSQIVYGVSVRAVPGHIRWGQTWREQSEERGRPPGACDHGGVTRVSTRGVSRGPMGHFASLKTRCKDWSTSLVACWVLCWGRYWIVKETRELKRRITCCARRGPTFSENTRGSQAETVRSRDRDLMT